MTYRWEGNLLKIKNLFSYLENILISRLYEQFSRKWSNLGHFLKFEKISNSVKYEHIIHDFETCDLEISNT